MIMNERLEEWQGGNKSNFQAINEYNARDNKVE